MTTGVRSLAVKVDSNDALDVRRFDVKQRISSLFEITVLALSPNPAIDFDEVVGQPASFQMDSGEPEASPRFWTGLCNHMQQLAVEDAGLSTYELTLVPTLWLATQRRNHRMFQQLSELAIVTPDFCKVHGKVVPFDIYQELSREKGAYADTVHACGNKVLKVGSVVRGVVGDMGKGVISTTSKGGGDVLMVEGSATIHVEGTQVCRDGDACRMNGK